MYVRGTRATSPTTSATSSLLGIASWLLVDDDDDDHPLFRSSNRWCYTGSCFIARFAAWPPRVTRLTEILIESETTPSLSANLIPWRDCDSILVRGFASSQLSPASPSSPPFDGLSRGGRTRNERKLVGRERDGREVDSGTASLR